MKKILKNEIKDYLKEFSIGNKKLLKSYDLNFNDSGDSFPVRNNYYSYDFLEKLLPRDRDIKILANTLLVYFDIIEKINIEKKENFIFYLKFHYDFEEEYRDEILFPYFSYSFLKNKNTINFYNIKLINSKIDYQKYIYELLLHLGIEKYFLSKCFLDSENGEYLILFDFNGQIGKKINLNDLNIIIN